MKKKKKTIPKSDVAGDITQGEHFFRVVVAVVIASPPLPPAVSPLRFPISLCSSSSTPVSLALPITLFVWENHPRVHRVTVFACDGQQGKRRGGRALHRGSAPAWYARAGERGGMWWKIRALA